MNHRWLVAYDIADIKRLRRVHRAASRGAEMLQYSVYLFAGPVRQFDPWRDALIGLIDATRDDLRMYPLPQDTWWRQYGAPRELDGVLRLDGLPPLLAGNPDADRVGSADAEEGVPWVRST